MRRKVQVDKNIDLAFSFAHQLLDNPPDLEALPPSSVVVFMPEDDAALANQNLELAGKLVRSQPRGPTPPPGVTLTKVSG